MTLYGRWACSFEPSKLRRRRAAASRRSASERKPANCNTGGAMPIDADQLNLLRESMLEHLEAALAIADETQDSDARLQIEQALDYVRAAHWNIEALALRLRLDPTRPTDQQIVMLRDHLPVASRIEADIGAVDQAGAVHQPHRRRAVDVLPQHVGLAVTVEIARPDHVPGRPRIEAHIGARQNVEAVHQPDRRRAVGVLPQDVGLAVAIEVA